MTQIGSMSPNPEGDRLPFERGECSRIIRDYMDDVSKGAKGKKATRSHTSESVSTSGHAKALRGTANDRELSFLKDALRTEEADPRNSQVSDVNLIWAKYSPSDEHPSGKDTHLLKFALETSEAPILVYKDSLVQFDKRELENPHEDRFLRFFSAVLETVGILLQARCSKVNLTCAFTKDIALTIEDSVWEGSDRPVLTVSVTDLKPKHRVPPRRS